jgi:hypothetical protein
VICFILLWLGVGNVLSVALPTRDEPLRRRHKSGTLRRFLIAFSVAYLVGYLVNLMLMSGGPEPVSGARALICCHSCS